MITGAHSGAPGRNRTPSIHAAWSVVVALLYSAETIYGEALRWAMPRHPYNPLGLPTEHERRARADELRWLFEMDAPRKPRKSRDGLPSYDTPQWRAAFGIPPDEDEPPPE